MGQQNVRIRIGGRKSVLVCIRTHGQRILRGIIVRSLAVVLHQYFRIGCCNCVLSLVCTPVIIRIISVYSCFQIYRRAYLVWISGNVVVRDKLVRVHSAGNIGIVVQVIFQQIFVFHAIDHIVRLCISKGLDAEIVQTAVSNRSVLFPLFCQFRCGHCLFSIVSLPGKNLYHIPLCGIVIVDFSIIECLLICQIGNGIFVVQFPVQRLVILGVVRGIARAVCRNRNDTIWQNVRDDWQRKRTLLPAVCAVAVQRLFIVIAAYANTAAVAVLIPVIIVLHMNIDPVDFTLCFGVVLLHIFAVHLSSITADRLANGCPAAYQRFPQHGSGAGFRIEHGLAAAVTVDAVIAGKAIAAAVCYDFLVLDIVAVDRGHIRRRCQIFQASKLSVTGIAVPIQWAPEVVHAVQLVVLCQHLGGTIPVVDVIDLVIQVILAALCHIRLCEHTVVPCAACRIGVYSRRKCHPCDIPEITASAIPLFQRLLHCDLYHIRCILVCGIVSVSTVCEICILCRVPHCLRGKILLIFVSRFLNDFCGDIYSIDLSECICLRVAGVGISQYLRNVQTAVRVHHRLHAIGIGIQECHTVQIPVTVVIRLKLYLDIFIIFQCSCTRPVCYCVYTIMIGV